MRITATKHFPVSVDGLTRQFVDAGQELSVPEALGLALLRDGFAVQHPYSDSGVSTLATPSASQYNPVSAPVQPVPEPADAATFPDADAPEAEYAAEEAEDGAEDDDIEEEAPLAQAPQQTRPQNPPPQQRPGKKFKFGKKHRR